MRLAEAGLWLWLRPLLRHGHPWLGPVGYPAAELDPGAEAQLVQDVGDMGLHGSLGQEQPGRDLLVAEVVGDEPRDVQLPTGERSVRLGLDNRRWLGRLHIFNREP